MYKQSLEKISDSTELERAIAHYIQLQKENSAGTNAYLKHIIFFLKQFLRQATRKTISQHPEEVLIILQILLNSLCSNQVFLSSSSAVELLPQFFNLATYFDLDLNVAGLQDNDEDKKRMPHFASPVYFAKSLKQSAEIVQKPLDLSLDSKLSMRETQDRINRISDRIFVKIMLKAPTFQCLQVMTNLLLKPVSSSKRVGRVLLAFGLLFRHRLAHQRRMAPHLASALFILGGYLKNEAKSYLHTSSPIPETRLDNQQKLRQLSSDDMEFFQLGAMLRCCQHFVIAIQRLGSPRAGYGGVHHNNLKFYCAYTHQSYTDLQHERAGLPPDPFLKDATEVTHYCLLSLFDILQYLFEHMVNCKLKAHAKNSEIDPYSLKWKFTPKDPKEDPCKVFPSINLISLPGMLKFDWNYNVEGTSQFVITLLNAIHAIAPNFLLLYTFWNRKLATDLSSREEHEREAYCRVQNYNNVGFATYACLLLLLEERQHEGGALNGSFPSMMSPFYKLEVMLPELAALARDSRFFNLLAFTALERLLLPYMATDAPMAIPALGRKSLLYLQEVCLKMLLVIGTNLDDTPEDHQEISRGLALLLKRVLQRLQPEDARWMYKQLLTKIQIIEAEAFVIDCFKMDCGYRFQQLITAEMAQKVLDFSLCLRNSEIIDQVERVSSGLCFFRLILRCQGKKDAKLLQRAVLTQLRVDYLEPIRKQLADKELLESEHTRKLKLLEMQMAQVYSEGF